jgi:hypothetical protein
MAIYEGLDRCDLKALRPFWHAMDTYACTNWMGEALLINQKSIKPQPGPLTIDALSDRGMLWYQGHRVKLNSLDAALCLRVYEAYLSRQSILFIYPTPSYLLPSLVVATLLVNNFGNAGRKDLTPGILFYTGIDGRDLYADLGVGADHESISETFGFLRLDTEGLPLEPIKLTAEQKLVVTGHCTLPKDISYKPRVVVVDSGAFKNEALVALLKTASERWPAALFYVVSGDPVTPLVQVAARNGWGLVDLLHEAPKIFVPEAHDPFTSVAVQLKHVSDGIRRRVEVPADMPAPASTDLIDSILLARRHRSESVVARQFLALSKWLSDLAITPSEFEAYRLSSMNSYADRRDAIREQARHEGRNAQLIAGGVSVLNDLHDQLDKFNPKREALLEALLACWYEKKSVAVLVQRPGMGSVLTQAVQLLPEFIDMLDDKRLTFVSVSQLHKAASCDIVIVPSILRADAIWGLRTAIAPEMLFIAYGTEIRLLEWCLKELGLMEAPKALLGATKATFEVEQASEDTEVFIDLAALVSDGETEYAASENVPIVGPRCMLHFEDGEVIAVAESSLLQTVSDTEDGVKSQPAKTVQPGDLVLLVNGSVHQSLFELLRDRVDGQTNLSRALDVVKAFQRVLQSKYKEAIDGADWLTRVHHNLVALDSKIVNSSTVMQWVTGVRFGPNDPQDIRRLGVVLEVMPLESHYVDFYSAMQRVRTAHRELGRILIRALKSLFHDRDTKSIKISVDGENVILYDIVDAVMLKRVVRIEKERNDS